MEADSKTILITGSTDGVGRIVARKLASPDVQLLIHGRNRERGEQLAEEVQRGGANASFYQADLSSLDEVRTLAEKVRAEHPRLDVLPTIKASAPARIVNVASLGQARIDFDDIMMTRNYDGILAYRRSKLALVMFTFDLADELEGTGVTANCLHPATFMDTHMVHEAHIKPQSTPEEGAEAILHLAISPDVKGRSGEFFDGKRESRPNEQAFDRDARARLRELSFELAGLHPAAEPRPGSVEPTHAL